jgi:hypothetical protein
MAVALAVPGFGGYFIDETGAPTVYLTDVAQRPAAEAALAGFLDSFGWTPPTCGCGRRSTTTSSSTRGTAGRGRRRWPFPGSVFSTIDEGSNRLRFGGLDAAAVSSILNTVVALGVPAAAVDVVLTGPVVQAASLRDQIRPAHGGLQIQFFASPASPVYNCTIGFNALHDGVQSFVTNSHCSNVQGSTTLPTDYYQSTRGGVIPNPNHFIGSEVDDPAYTAGGECPAGRWCRYSDAARARYAPGQTFVLGSIARAAEFNAGTTSGDDDPSLIHIDDASPTWRITATQGTPVLGQRLNKTGRTTGWTAGEVTGTCVNVNISASEITQLCQSMVGAFVAGGDSGSPVFGEHTDGSVFLAGILWGSSTNLTTGQVQFLFSPLAAVERAGGAHDGGTGRAPGEGTAEEGAVATRRGGGAATSPAPPGCCAARAGAAAAAPPSPAPAPRPAAARPPRG